MQLQQEWITSIVPELRRYCVKISGSAWEADDLVQETVVRLIRTLEQAPERPLSRAYAYRTALNLWRDHCRKQKRAPAPLEIGHAELVASGDTPLAARELLEQLAERLSPFAFVAVLLADVFDFTARETASMIASTEGAVQVALSRARKKLRTLASAEGGKPHVQPPRPGADEAGAGGSLLEAVLDGFRKRNPKTIYEAYLRLTQGGVQLQTIRSFGGRYYFTFEDPDGNVLMITSDWEQDAMPSASK